MIQTVISDMGNVVLFFDHMIFIRKIAEYTPYSPSEVLSILEENISLIKNFSRGKLEPDGYVEEMIRLLDAEVEEEKFITFYREIFSVNRNVLETLKKTKASSLSPQLVLLSNTDSLHFEYIREAFPEIFIFDEYVLSYETGSLKPETEIYKNALKQAGISPEEAVFIDDLEENVKAADKLGMKGILYRKGMDLRLELSRYGISFSGQHQG